MHFSSSTRPRFRALAVSLVTALVAAVLVSTGTSAANAVVTHTITGHVYLGSSATPAATGNAVVEFTLYGSSHRAQDVVPVAADGSYAIAALEGAWYTLFVRYTGGASYTSMYWPGIPVGASQTVPTVDVWTGDRSGIDVTLPAYANLHGTVSLGTSAVVAGAGEVEVRYRVYGTNSSSESAPVSTDAAGNFSFGLMPAGRYLFRFDYLPSEDFQDVGPRSGYTYRGSVEDFNFPAGTVDTPNNVTLPPAVSITGLVKLANNDAGSFNLPGAGEVKVSYGEYNLGTATLAALGSVYTTADGTYTVPGLNSTRWYVLTFEYVPTSDYIPYSTPSRGQSDWPITNVSLDRTYTVAGHVNLIDSSRSVSAGEVKVKFCYFNFGYETCPGSALADASGNYSVSGLTGRQYFVRLEYYGTDNIQTQMAEFSDRLNQWPVWRPGVGNTTLNLTLRYANSVSGTVTDSSGAPMPGAVLWVVQYTPGTTTEIRETQSFTDAAGHYFVGGLPDGTFGVEFRADGGFAQQAWPGWSSRFHEPGTFELNGGVDFDADAEMYRSGAIQGTITSSGIPNSDFYDEDVVASLYLKDPDSGIFYFTGDQVTIPWTGAYSFPNLWPDDYKVRITYIGSLGVANRMSGVLTVGENQTKTFSPFLSPVIPVNIGDRIKGPGPTVYLVDAFMDLIPLASWGSVTDAGLPATYKAVTQAVIDNYDVDPDVLSNVLRCSGLTYLSAEGKIWPIDEALVDGLEWSFVADELCDLLPHGSTTIEDNLSLTSSAALNYSISADGKKHQVLTTASLAALAAPHVPRVYRVSDYFLGTIPTGLKVLPQGSMVKGPGSRVWFVTSADTVVPVLSFDVTTDMGLPSTYFTVSQAELDQAGPIDDAGTALTNTVVCPGQTYFSASGKLWPVAASLVAGLRQTALSASACAAMPKVSAAIQGGLFVQSTTSAATYHITSTGEKRQVSGRVTMGRLSYPYEPVVVRTSSSFLNSLPTGSPIVPFLGKKPPAGTVQTPLASAPTTLLLAPTLNVDERATCYTDYFQALGAGLFAPMSQTVTLDADCRRELGLEAVPAG